MTPARHNSGGAVITVYAASGHLLAGDGATGVTGVAWTPATTAPKSLDTVGDPERLLDRRQRASLVQRLGRTAPWFMHPAVRCGGAWSWVDRNGAVTPVPGEPDSINEAVVSRDGKRIVRHGNASKWVEDLAAGTRTRIVSDLLTYSAGWLPGSDRIVVSSNVEGDWDLYTVSASGGTMTSLLKKPLTQHPMSVAPDGSVIYVEAHPENGTDLWILPAGGQPRPLVVTPFNERSAAASWDGKSVAYASDESGRFEVYVRPLSGPGERTTVSVDGGTGPVWSRDGRELFYRSGDYLMSAEVKSMSPLVLGARTRLMDVSQVRGRLLPRFRRFRRRPALPVHPRRARRAPHARRRDPQLVPRADAAAGQVGTCRWPLQRESRSTARSGTSHPPPTAARASPRLIA